MMIKVNVPWKYSRQIFSINIPQKNTLNIFITEVINFTIM